MTYATSTAVSDMVKGIDKNIKTDNMTRAISDADIEINSQLLDADIPVPTNFTPTGDDDPLNLLLDAGNLFASAYLLDMNFVSPDNRRPTATSYENRANTLVARYIKIYESTNDTTVIGVVSTYVLDKDYQ